MTDDEKQPEPVDIHVGQAIRRRRRVRGLTQDALAEGMGVTAQQVQKYETAVTRISASRLFKAATVLKAPVSYFFSELDEREFELFSAEIEANVASFLKSSDGQELAIIFPQIQDVAVRKQFVNLARAMANATQGLSGAD